MTNETATPEKKALLEAFDTVLKAQAEEREARRQEEEARRAARARSRPVMWACAAILLFVGTYLWVEQPDWVFPNKPLPESTAVKDAGLRIGMANAAQHIERYRQRNGRLPASLAEAGAHGDGLSYERGATGETWRLEGQNGPTSLTLTSTEPLSKFLGSSFEVISRRGR
ncbi:MAG TPA: hypothetical protein VFT84_03840 [Gemmatimonadales bacterium]|nr:hypothetical protein [Gemmatimonadales bacterium]